MASIDYLRVSAVSLAMVAAALVAVLASSGLASAQSTIGAVPGTTIKVNTTEDESNADGDCSLREAIEAANTNLTVDGCAAGNPTERDGIHFALGRKATIVLGSTLPAITDASGLTINGQKAKITVSGNDAVRVFEVDSGAKLTLARLTVANGFIDGNGGGIENVGGTLKVTNSTFSGNSADFGGGIYNAGGPLTVTDSTFSGNSAHDFSGAGGGGIYNAGGPLTVTNSTFSGNSTNLVGGGISNSATLTVTNSTFSGNSADFGGGIHTSGTFATATLKNTIVANSPSGGNCAGGITDGGYNIDDGNTCGFSAANNSKPNTDPMLDPDGLQNNGGPTKTIMLLKGSPAVSVIPKGTNGCGTEIKTDQRGVGRPKGPGCDIGAFEKRRHVQPNP